jgi:hypothetical protein
MGHYDECRPGYCPACGAAPGNMKNGRCEFCSTKPNPTKEKRPAAVPPAAAWPFPTKSKKKDLRVDAPDVHFVAMMVSAISYVVTRNGVIVASGLGTLSDAAERAAEYAEGARSLSKTVAVEVRQ